MTDYQYNALKAMRKLPIGEREWHYHQVKRSYDPNKHNCTYDQYVLKICEALNI